MELPTIFTVDVGPDDAVLGEGRSSTPRWNRTAEGIFLLRDSLRLLEEEFGAPLPVTWFVRADDTIRRQFGSENGIFRRFERFLREAIDAGHEVGWMPQFSAKRGERETEANDLAKAHAALTSLGIKVRCARTGDLQHDNDSMATMDALGIEFDSSALPGRSRLEEGWRLDWRMTPQRPYRPSVADYRVPGNPHLALCEIPLSIVPIKSRYDEQPLPRYVNPCMHSELLWQKLAELLQVAPYLMLILHPDEIVRDKQGKGHPLIAYSPDEMLLNIRKVVATCLSLSLPLSFQTLGEFGSGERRKLDGEKG